MIVFTANYIVNTAGIRWIERKKISRCDRDEEKGEFMIFVKYKGDFLNMYFQTQLQRDSAFDDIRLALQPRKKELE